MARVELMQIFDTLDTDCVTVSCDCDHLGCDVTPKQLLNTVTQSDLHQVWIHLHVSPSSVVILTPQFYCFSHCLFCSRTGCHPCYHFRCLTSQQHYVQGLSVATGIALGMLTQTLDEHKNEHTADLSFEQFSTAVLQWGTELVTRNSAVCCFCRFVAVYAVRGAVCYVYLWCLLSMLSGMCSACYLLCPLLVLSAALAIYWQHCHLSAICAMTVSVCSKQVALIKI